MRNLLTRIALCSLIAQLGACQLHEIKQQTKAVEDVVTISGTVERQVSDDQQIYVQIYKKQDQGVKLVAQTPLKSDGSFSVDTLPGKLIVAAYIDNNDNQDYDTGEPAAHLSDTGNQPRVIDVPPGQKLQDQTITISGDATIEKTFVVSNGVSKLRANLGKIVSIDDPMFLMDNAATGLWRPVDFVQQIGGGLLFLEEYDPNKQIILFVHGISGSPLEFKSFIDTMDTSRYQALVYFYPSGLPLDIVSNYLLDALTQLQDKHQFVDLTLVAHSMGGLMCRSFLMKHQAANSAFTVSRHVTINSPLHGMKSAVSGVEYSPIVINVWRDLVPDSEYIQRVHGWQMPESIDYHLVFSYLEGKDGDGVVPMGSQLSRSLQEEATSIHGFNTQHAEILKDNGFIEALKVILE